MERITGGSLTRTLFAGSHGGGYAFVVGLRSISEFDIQFPPHHFTNFPCINSEDINTAGLAASRKPTVRSTQSPSTCGSRPICSH